MAEKLSESSIVDSSILSDEELNAEIEKGFDDIAAGRTKAAQSVFDEIRKAQGSEFASHRGCEKNGGSYGRPFFSISTD